MYQSGLVPLARIIDAWTKPAGKDPLGQLSAGSIKVASSALVPLDPSYVKGGARCFDGVSCTHGNRFTLIVFDTADEVTRPVYLLPLVEHEAKHIVEAIAVEEVEGHKATFSRIGHFSAEGRLGSKDVLHVDMELDGSATAASLCAEEDQDPEHPEQRYVITLI